jgi:hypothetical protein
VPIYDLCLAWNWEYDADLAALLEAACRAHGLSFLQVTAHNLAATWQALLSAELGLRVLFDRASDEQAPFLALHEWAQTHGVRRINPREKALLAWDKASMHAEFARAGLRTPLSLILAPFETQPELGALELESLGTPFVVKPACRGGGLGVVPGATSLAEVLAARQLYPADRYLLQTRVEPMRLGARRAWFRVIYSLGHVHACWWDCQTHVYTPLGADEKRQFELLPLDEIAQRIARVCGLDLFSTEIALCTDGSFVSVDYVNDPLDLRLQSKTPEGVPDAIVRSVAEQLLCLAG